MRRDIKLVGILNFTPDSFSDGGRYFSVEPALAQIDQLFQNGASLVDIGAESTRPDATPLTAEQEWQRLEPLLQQVVPAYRESISLDTYHPETIRRVAAEMGPIIVNDVTGMNNPAMQQAVAELGLTCVVSHLPKVVGQDIQKGHEAKPVDSVQQVVDELSERVDELAQRGVHSGSIIIDPGFGFGKDPSVNSSLLELPRHMEGDNFFIGVSRKRSLKQSDFYKEPLADFEAMSPQELETWLDWRSVEVAKIAVKNGFTYIRVHNVAAHKAGLHI